MIVKVALENTINICDNLTIVKYHKIKKKTIFGLMGF